MKIRDLDFMGVLLGSDINTYSMARAFYEEYGIKTKVIGKYYTGPSHLSKITEFYADPKIEDPKIFVKILNDFAKSVPNKKLIILGCGDNYVRLIIENRNKLAKNYIVPYVEQNLMEKLIKKEKFYEMCDKYGISYPKTFIYNKKMKHKFDLDFPFPVIAKPSNSVDYFSHAFNGQHKVYKINSREELEKTLDEIYNNGYNDDMILQEFIPGDDTHMRVMTCYSNSSGKVKLMCLGHTMLEEHSPLGIGNHAVVITEYNEELSMQIKNFLESIHYTGFSNFDIKYDERNHKFKVFEINLRQGRSNYYVTGAGYNLAKQVVEDRVYNHDLGFEIAKNEYLWTMIPISVAYKHITEKKYITKMKELVKQDKWVNPLFKKHDNHPKRVLRLIHFNRMQAKAFDRFLNNDIKK